MRKKHTILMLTFAFLTFAVNAHSATQWCVERSELKCIALPIPNNRIELVCSGATYYCEADGCEYTVTPTYSDLYHIPKNFVTVLNSWNAKISEYTGKAGGESYTIKRIEYTEVLATLNVMPSQDPEVLTLVGTKGTCSVTPYTSTTTEVCTYVPDSEYNDSGFLGKLGADNWSAYYTCPNGCKYAKYKIGDQPSKYCNTINAYLMINVDTCGSGPAEPRDCYCNATAKSICLGNGCVGEYSCPGDACPYIMNFANKDEIKSTMLRDTVTSEGTRTCPQQQASTGPATSNLSLGFAPGTTPEQSTAGGGGVANAINEKLELAENNPVANTFCRIYDTVLATAFVVAAILWTVTGIGFFIGKISWGIVVAIGVGSALTVGSSKLAAQFVLGSTDIQDACDCRHGVNCESPYE